MPWMRLRVVCGLRVTIATFSPTRAFSSVDLPALGRPMMETKPLRTNALDRGGGRGQTDTQAFHPAICRLKDLIAQGTGFDDLPGLWYAARRFTDQSGN